MNKEQRILSDVYKNKCPCCNKDRVYKTKCGLNRANKLNLVCRSCANSISSGGLGNIYLNNQKSCHICKVYKDLDCFYLYDDGHLHSCCKGCSKIRSEEYHKSIYRFNKYNIDKDYYDNLVLEQNSKCKICSKVTLKFHIDHCHSTGKVRGLLCGKCNKALGLVNDNKEILKNAIKYLEINE